MKKIALVLLGIIAAVVLLVGGFYLGQQMSSSKSLQPTATQQADTTRLSPTATPSANTGTVEGSLNYPSEGIPDDMFVCVETLTGTQVACTDEHIENQKYQYGLGYMLEIEPGTYYVYSQIPDDGYKAYYTEFVPCGLSVGCTSHAKIQVDVSAGQITSGVDPIDWYDTGPGN